MKFLHCAIIIITVMALSHCDGETGYDTESRIKLELKYIYPKKAEDIPINAAIVISFNMPVDKTSVNSESIQVISADDDTRLDITWEVMGNLVIVKPAQGKLMAANTGYSINIVNITNKYGKKLLLRRVTDFITGNSIDESGPVAYEAAAKEETNEIIVTFDEVVKHWGISDNAVEVYDITNEKAVPGEIVGVENSNQVRFIPDVKLKLNSKYRITINGEAGIIDFTGNEYSGDPISFEIFTEPRIDNDPPFIKYINTDTTSNPTRYIIAFSEKINKEIYENFIGRMHRGWNDKAIFLRDPNLHPDLLLYRGIIDDIEINDDHDEIVFTLPDLDPTYFPAGKVLILSIYTDAFYDLKGNMLINNPLNPLDESVSLFREGPELFRNIIIPE